MNQFSISMFVIDSAAQNQFARHMKLTMELMRQEGFQILQGYNKVIFNDKNY